MYSSNNVFERLVNNKKLITMTSEDIEVLCKKNDERIFRNISELRIHGVSENIYKLIAQYGIDNDLDEDEFLDLIEIKIMRHFFNR